MPSKFTQRILSHIKNPKYAPKSVTELERYLRIPPEEDDEFRSAIGALIEQDRLVLGREDVIQLPPMPSEFSGKIKITTRGFGFVTPEIAYRGGDLYIPENGMMDAISGDRVRVVMNRQSGRSGGGPGKQGQRTRGRIVEILERNKTSFTGTMATATCSHTCSAAARKWLYWRTRGARASTRSPRCGSRALPAMASTCSTFAARSRAQVRSPCAALPALSFPGSCCSSRRT